MEMMLLTRWCSHHSMSWHSSCYVHGLRERLNSENGRFCQRQMNCAFIELQISRTTSFLWGEVHRINDFQRTRIWSVFFFFFRVLFWCCEVNDGNTWKHFRHEREYKTFLFMKYICEWTWYQRRWQTMCQNVNNTKPTITTTYHEVRPSSSSCSRVRTTYHWVFRLVNVSNVCLVGKQVTIYCISTWQ